MKISGLTIATAVAMYAAASPAKALTLTMACEGYNVVFSPGSLMSHAPKKDRDYPITKVDVQNDRIVVTGGTKYGKITAFFSNDGHPSIVWTNGKDVVLNQCASDVASSPQSPVQKRLEDTEAATRAEAAAQRAKAIDAPVAEAPNADQILSAERKKVLDDYASILALNSPDASLGDSVMYGAPPAVDKPKAHSAAEDGYGGIDMNGGGDAMFERTRDYAKTCSRDFFRGKTGTFNAQKLVVPGFVKCEVDTLKNTFPAAFADEAIMHRYGKISSMRKAEKEQAMANEPSNSLMNVMLSLGTAVDDIFLTEMLDHCTHLRGRNETSIVSCK